MIELKAIFFSSLDWISSNPIISSLIPFIIAGLGIYATTILQAFANSHAGRLLAKRGFEEEVFDEPSGPLLENRTKEALNEITAEDLIKLYGKKERPFHIQIGSTDWSFASSRALEPIGDGTIREQTISIIYREEWFELDDELNWLTADRLKALQDASSGEQLFNGDPFRIIDITGTKSHPKIEVGRCKYFDSLRTSFSMDFVLPSHGKSLREILHASTGTFGPFLTSRLPNHMGLVVIIETTDGRLIVQERSANVQVRPRTYSASVSGTFEKNDLVTSSGLVQLVDTLGGVMREIHGELGGRYSYNAENFYFMGLMREFRRGGFPDLYFYYQSPHTFDEVYAHSKDAEESFEVDNIIGFYVGSRSFIQDPLNERSQFDRRINQLLNSIEGRANLTLSLGIGLFYETTIRRASRWQS